SIEGVSMIPIQEGQAKSFPDQDRRIWWIGLCSALWANDLKKKLGEAEGGREWLTRGGVAAALWDIGSTRTNTVLHRAAVKNALHGVLDPFEGYAVSDLVLLIVTRPKSPQEAQTLKQWYEKQRKRWPERIVPSDATGK